MLYKILSKDQLADTVITCGDFSENMLQAAEANIQKNSWPVKTQVIDMQVRAEETPSKCRQTFFS